MRNLMAVVLCAGLVISTFHFTESRILAVDTVSDWTGTGNTGSALAPANNYVVQSTTSVGGTFQDVVPIGPGGTNFADFHLADTLDAPLSFSNELHMTGTMTFSNAGGVLPNLCFCWFDKDDTTHRIGLGFASSTTAPYINLPNYMRIDLGFAASGGNYFPFVSKNGALDESSFNSVIPDGTYSFTFDYVPGTSNAPGGSMTATVSNATVGTLFSNTIPIGVRPQPPADYNNNNTVDAGDYVAWRKGGTLQNEVDNPGTNDAGDYGPWRANYGKVRTGTLNLPWINDFFQFDSFGFVQRVRTNPPGTGASYSLTISNITYTGGTSVGSGSGFGAGAVPEPTTAALALLFGLAAAAFGRRTR
jgi:hypothetical protein